MRGDSEDMDEDADCWPRLDELSESQRICLRLVNEGYTSKEIARRTDLTPLTIDQYMSKAVVTLGVSNRREAARLLIEAETSEFSQPALAEPADALPHANVPGRSVLDHVREIIRLPPVGGERHNLDLRERAAIVLRIAIAQHNLAKSKALRIASFYELATLRFLLPIIALVSMPDLPVAILIAFVPYAYPRLLAYMNSKAILDLDERRQANFGFLQIASLSPLLILIAHVIGSAVLAELTAYYLFAYGGWWVLTAMRQPAGRRV